MKYRMYFTYRVGPEDLEDSIVVEAETQDEVKRKARIELSRRDGIGPRFEKIED